MTTSFINLFEYENAARERLPKMVFDYYVGAANDKITLRDNRAAFDMIKLHPRVLVDVSQCDTTTTLFGQQFAVPVMIAPMALAKMAHADGEIGIARAAGQFKIPLILSTLSATALEDVAQTAFSPLWFQLYVYTNRNITRDLIKRAEDSGYQAVVVTVDAPVPGKREDDIRNGFKLPEGISLENLKDYHFSSFSLDTTRLDLASDAISQIDDTITWKDLEWICSLTRLPVLVKGILRADDALKARDSGAKGIIVSNHGGRQLDTAPATIAVLPDIVSAVGDELEILLDGGIRRGTDILKALALGAKAVLVGRPVLWGLAVSGESGVYAVLRILQDEFTTAMRLCGCRSIKEAAGLTR